jgi:hypothetical protein
VQHHDAFFLESEAFALQKLHLPCNDERRTQQRNGDAELPGD